MIAVFTPDEDLLLLGCHNVRLELADPDVEPQLGIDVESEDIGAHF